MERMARKVLGGLMIAIPLGFAGGLAGLLVWVVLSLVIGQANLWVCVTAGSAATAFQGFKIGFGLAGKGGRK